MARERVETQQTSSGRWGWTRWIGQTMVRRSLSTYTTKAKARKAANEKKELPPVGRMLSTYTGRCRVCDETADGMSVLCAACGQENYMLWTQYGEIVG